MFEESLRGVAPLQALGVGIGLFLTGFFVRRRYFSPLSDIPGPFVASFTSSLWQLWQIAKGHTEAAVIELHQKHGKFVRIGQNEVSVCDVAAIREVLMSHMDKGSIYKVFTIPDRRYINQMSETNCKLHIQKAKNLAAGFSLTNVIKQEPYIDNALQRLESQLDKLSSLNKPVKWEEWLNYLAFDILGEATFSQSFGFLEAGKDIGRTVANNVFLRLYLSILGHFPWAHDYLLANPMIEYFNLTPSMHVFDTAMAAINLRSKNDEVRMDMLEQWKEQWKKHPERISEQDIIANAVVNLGAGSDTVSSVMQAFLYHMIHDAEMLEMLRTELDGAKLSGVPTYEETRELPVLQACIKEALRFHPAVGFGLPRIAPPEGVTVCGRYFKPGTILSVNSWAVHRMTPIFGEDAANFNPRRWLDPERARKMDSAMIPFGAGYNQCPGKHLAHIEMSKTFSTLMRDYDIELVDPSKEWKYESYFTVAPHDWPCKVKRRTPKK